MLIEALTSHTVKAQSTNSTDASFPAHIPTVTKPAASATRAVFDRGLGANCCTLRITPYAVGSNNQTMNIQIVGWNRCFSPGVTGISKTEIWIPRIACEVQGTLSSSLVGIANADIVATELFCDTLTLTSGISVLYQGTADSEIACFTCGVSAYSIFEVQFKLGTVSTSMNALVQQY